MTEESTYNAEKMDKLVARCLRDTEKLSPREAVRKYPLLALVAAAALPQLSGEQLAMVVGLAMNRGLVDAAQKCQSCAAGSAASGNLCQSCYEGLLGGKLSQYA